MNDAAKQPSLFDAQTMEPVDLTAITLPDGPALRVVYFDVTDEVTGEVEEDTRPCLVRCDDGQRNVKSVRRLFSLCERACTTATRTSAIPPKKFTYCQACLAKAGNGVLK